MGSNALSPLAALTLTWLLPRKGARGPRNALERRLRPLFEHRLSGAAWAEAFESEVGRLVARGLVSHERQALTLTDEGGRYALELLGLRRLPPKATFDDLYKKHLVPRAVTRRYGAPLSSKELAELGDAKRLGAFVAAKAHGLRLRSSTPTRAQLRDALVWQALGFERHDELSLPKLVLAVLSRLAGADHARSTEQAVDRLITRALGARRTGPDEVRAAVVRAWVDDEQAATAQGDEGGPATARSKSPSPEAPTPARANHEGHPQGAAGVVDDGRHGLDGHRALSLAEFAARVMLEARRAQEGRFGERKVFISHLTRHLAPSFCLDDSAFKGKLVEAHRAGLLTLSRADLVGAMPSDAVAASETSYLGATFHFVVAEPAPAPAP